MSSTTASARTALTQRAEELLKRIRQIPYLSLVMAVAAAAAVLLVILLWARSPDYKTLFSNLSDTDGSAIVTQLDQMKVPYRLAANGSTIMIPSGQVDEVRLALAGQGLPKASGVGFELMDKQAFGISQFAEHVNYQRALEGELARSIETVDAVEKARVHLAIPAPSVFVRDRRKPSASIVVHLRSGRTLDQSQVAAITHLVSSSVSEMPNDAISIVDQRGELLTKNGNPDSIDDAQFKYTQQIEREYQKRLESILGAMMGPENVRAVVTADVDFSRAEHTQELYDPNSDPKRTALRSQQTSESRQVGSTAVGGVPGAISNQPPGTAASPINAQDQQTTRIEPPNSTRRDQTSNYEVNRTIRHVQEQRGVVKRLSVAVVVNYRPAPAKPATADAPAAPTEQKDGNAAQPQQTTPATEAAPEEGQPIALDAATMDRIKRVARETMGYSEARGDSLEIVNAPLTPTVDEDTTPWWENPLLAGFLSNYGRYIVYAIIAWLLWRKLVRPHWLRYRDRLEQQRRLQELTAQEEEEEEDDDTEFEREVAQIKRQQHENRIRDVRERARQDPSLIAMILKGWMHESEDKK
ncbi:flagellar basal-body MS-ring/collar protein FliF [Zymobacter sp. IVIA_5232.4 C2]|uniref:flagellar basal-body MS-ring/collar protein FliF n=1 Tax=Zymobacter sp. IVIA_5232.4 C2 TaxID=3394855 RepID=UPI0039C42139